MVSHLRRRAKRAPRSGARPKIVTIGGGTGHFALLSGLKKHDVDLTAVVTMADNGGSTGQLRDELGVLPPGDLRQCLVALSEEDDVMRALFAHRFDRGTLRGHTLGNLVLSGLEQVTGSIDEAVARVGSILKIRGVVLPVSLERMNLRMTLQNGKVLRGEHAIDSYPHIARFGVATVALQPLVALNPAVRWALSEADLVVVGPGDLYTSLLPNLLVDGLPRALERARAQKVLVANLMNKFGVTDGFTVGDQVRAFAEVLGRQVFDTVLYYDGAPPRALLRRYLDEGEPVRFDPETVPAGVRAVSADLLADAGAARVRGDRLQRSLIRHDPDRLAGAVVALLDAR
jgi:uncharacterized cofD-like protein